MCLISRTNEPLIATEEIKIYKKCRLYENNKLHSYFNLFTGQYHYSKVEEAIISPDQVMTQLVGLKDATVFMKGYMGY